MLRSIVTWPAKFIKYPGLKYGEPKLRYAPGEEVNKPVVLIFGWLGATERYVSKYTQLYHDKGMPLSFIYLFSNVMLQLMCLLNGRTSCF